MKIFVPWRWFAGAVIAAIVSIVTMSAMAASRLSTVEERSHENRSEIRRLEERVDKKLDRIMVYLEERR